MPRRQGRRMPRPRAAGASARARSDAARDRRRAAGRRGHRGVAVLYERVLQPDRLRGALPRPPRRRRAPPMRSPCPGSRSIPPSSRLPDCRPTASDALLRRAALATLTDVHIVSATTGEDGITTVTVAYSRRPLPGDDDLRGGARRHDRHRADLAVRDEPARGDRPHRARVDVVRRQRVRGRQAAGLAGRGGRRPARLARRCSSFSPGIYSVSVDTAISSTPGVAVLSDSPMQATPVEVQAAADRQVRRGRAGRGSRSSSPPARPRTCCSRPRARSATTSRIASCRRPSGRSRSSRR